MGEWLSRRDEEIWVSDLREKLERAWSFLKRKREVKTSHLLAGRGAQSNLASESIVMIAFSPRFEAARARARQVALATLRRATQIVIIASSSLRMKRPATRCLVAGDSPHQVLFGIAARPGSCVGKRSLEWFEKLRTWRPASLTTLG